MIGGLYEQFQLCPRRGGAEQDRPNSPLYWQQRLGSRPPMHSRTVRPAISVRTLVTEKLTESIRAHAGRPAAQQGTLRRSRGRPTRRQSARAQYRGAPFGVFFGRGIVLERLKQWPKAEQDMKKALEALARAAPCAELPRLQLDRSGPASRRRHEDVERATELRPDDGAITDSVGLGLLSSWPVRQGLSNGWSGPSSRRGRRHHHGNLAMPTGMSDAFARRASNGSGRSTRSRTGPPAGNQDKLANG